MNTKRAVRLRYILMGMAVLMLLPWIHSCVGEVNTAKRIADEFGGKLLPMKYAKGFKVYEKKGVKRILILNPIDSTEVLGDIIVEPRSKRGVAQYPNSIKVPLERTICLSSTQIAYFTELNAIGSLVGINSSDYLFNKDIKARIADGKILRLGKEGNFDVEKIAGLNPDVVFVSPIKAGGYDAIVGLGLHLVPITAYDETTPLARAEWIKLIAIFTGQEAEANRIFAHAEKEYLRLKALAANVKSRPTVFSGKMKGDSWYVPGGESFYAIYFKDAGADYIIKDKDKGGSTVDFETIYQKAAHCDFWRLRTSSPAGFNSASLLAEDPRYGYFDAFKNRKVMLINLRETPYDEINPVRPHQMLADYISFFHPELLPKYRRVFYDTLTYSNEVVAPKERRKR